MTNDIYSWNMPSMDSGALITADGKMIPMPLVNELGRLGRVEELTEKEIMDLIGEKREHDRQAEFQRLNVDTSASPPAPTEPSSVKKTARRNETEPVQGYCTPTQEQFENSLHLAPLPTYKPKPSAMSNDEIWDELIDLQDTLRKYYLELGGRRIKGAGKWLMNNVQYINNSQMEGIGIRSGFNLDEVPSQDFVSED